MPIRNKIQTLVKVIAAGGIGYYGAKIYAQKDAYCDMNTTDYNTPVYEWDRNWDKRDPTYRVLTHSSFSTDRKDQMESLDKFTPKGIRNIYLIRHGQYNLKGECDEERSLTSLGKKQSELTGKRLKVILDKSYDKLIVSNMTRALETAEIIRKELCPCPGECNCKLRLSSFCSEPDPLLREGAPIRPTPPSRHFHPDLHYYEDGVRIEAAFRKYFHRALPEEEKETFEIIVCHANVIRYFCCRALQFPANRWLQMSLPHGSITKIQIYPDGEVVLMQYGDSSHMQINYVTRS